MAGGPGLDVRRVVTGPHGTAVFHDTIQTVQHLGLPLRNILVSQRRQLSLVVRVVGTPSPMGLGSMPHSPHVGSYKGPNHYLHLDDMHINTYKHIFNVIHYP